VLVARPARSPDAILVGQLSNSGLELLDTIAIGDNFGKARRVCLQRGQLAFGVSEQNGFPRTPP
jgi:hypothetical protein